VDNADKAKGVELVDSEDVSGVPTNPNMTNTSVVDELIEKGDIKDLSSDENKNNVPPAFTPISLNGLGCRSSGVFTIKGKLNKKIDKHFRFNLPLSYPSVDTKCTIPESEEGKEITITCQAKSPFTKSKIIIEPLTISKNNSEVISVLSTSSEDEISCEDYQAVSLKKKRKKFKAPYSFRQAQNFRKGNGKISFLLYLLKKAGVNIPNKDIEIKVRPVKSKNGRRLLEFNEDFVPVNMDCTPDSTNGNAVELNCTGDGDNPTVILDGDDLGGLPSNESDSNPENIDGLIGGGIIIDCTNNKCASLSKFKNGTLVDDDAKAKKGIFNIKGEIEGTIPNGSVFNLSIYPDSYGDCQINNQTKIIECYNKEEIEKSMVMIEETVVRNKNGTPLFLLDGGVKSTRNNISYSINENNHTELSSSTSPSSGNTTNPDDPTRTPVNTGSKGYFGKGGSGDKGLSGGAIAGIVIACAVAVIVALLVAYLIKGSGKPGINSSVTAPMENSNDIGNSVGHFKATT
jgi:hypothetical protein